MPGNYKAFVVFPFDFERSKTARIQIEPFVCSFCYGMIIKVILELTGGNGDNQYEYERVAYEDTITQENIRDGFMSAPFMEVMEGFYYNKTEKDILIPVCALILKIYFSEILEAFNINLDSYITNVEYKSDSIGFSSQVNYANKLQTNHSQYQSTESSKIYTTPKTYKEKRRSNCKEIIQCLKKKNSKS